MYVSRPAIAFVVLTLGMLNFANSARADYPSWLNLWFPPAEQIDPNLLLPEADFDGDGVRNLAEYAFRLNPRVSDVSQPPLLTASPLFYRFQFEFRRNKEANDVIW